MLDERILITLEKVGQETKNANELSCDLINAIAKDIPEWQEDYYKGHDEKFLNCEEIYDNAVELGDKNQVNFKLSDGSTWKYIRNEYKCILHSNFDYSNEIGTIIFKSLDEDNLYKCADKDCGKFLKEYKNSEPWLLFPRDWTDEGIEAWCKKREKKQEEYEEEHERRYRGKRQDYLNFIDKDCTTCCHMKHGECEYCNEIEYECEDWEERKIDR